MPNKRPQRQTHSWGSFRHPNDKFIDSPKQTIIGQQESNRKTEQEPFIRVVNSAIRTKTITIKIPRFYKKQNLNIIVIYKRYLE